MSKTTNSDNGIFGYIKIYPTSIQIKKKLIPAILVCVRNRFGIDGETILGLNEMKELYGKLGEMIKTYEDLNTNVD